MVSDLNTQLSRKKLIIRSASFFVLAVMLIMVYWSLRQNAYVKTEPYNVQIIVSADSDATIIVYYDYGYGYHIDHHRRIELSSMPEPQAIEFSVSAWKTVHALRLDGFDDSGIKLDALQIEKGAELYQLNASELALDANTSRIIVGDVITHLGSG